MRKKLVAANWKMHGSRSMAIALVDAIAEHLPSGMDVLLCPPYPYLSLIAEIAAGHGLGVGAQDVSEHAEEGAYTGEVAASMIADVGAHWTVIGHSERRLGCGESDDVVARKFAAARAAGLTPILCVGETLAEYEAGETFAVLQRQLAAVIDLNGIDSFDTAVIAYEPVWAIGSGLSASPARAQEVHAFIRSRLAEKDAMISQLTRLLYGGSVKAANAADLFAQPDVDGGLVGGASLLAKEFEAICAAAAA